MKKPDNVSDNPGLLPYGSNVGAPAIITTNIEHWKEPRVSNVNKQFEDRFEELKKEYQNLIDEYKWNDLVYKSKFSFEPVIGKIYHLYYANDGKIFSDNAHTIGGYKGFYRTITCVPTDLDEFNGI